MRKAIPISPEHHRMAKTAAAILGMDLKDFTEKCLEQEAQKIINTLEKKPIN